MSDRSYTSLAIFLLLTALLVAAYGNFVVLTADEGILLEPAQRIAQGERPYVDFFAYMSPGSYWVQSLVFRALGVSLRTGRLVVIIDFAAQCALLFSLVRRYASRRAAFSATTLYFVFQSVSPGLLTAQHRWDSATAAMLGMVLCLEGVERRRPLLVAGAGAAAAFAALCTPTVGLAGAITLGWLAWDGERKKWWTAYLAGAAATTLVAVSVLAKTGTLLGCLQQFLWLKRNYSGVNVMPYGSIIGGYSALFQDADLGNWLLRLGLVACIALPAILPPAAICGWAVASVRRTPADARAMLYLTLCVAGLVATAFPRADVMHLAFVAAPSYALAAIWISRYSRPGVGAMVVVFFGVWAAAFLDSAVVNLRDTRRIATPVGALDVPQQHAAAFERLLQTVRPGDGMYVHPYMPIVYFWTQARNVTRYAYLNPGMMNAVDEARVVEDLTHRAPRWVLHLTLDRREFLRVFPSGHNASSRFERVERWLQTNYEPAPERIEIGGYRLWRRKASDALYREPDAN